MKEAPASWIERKFTEYFRLSDFRLHYNYPILLVHFSWYNSRIQAQTKQIALNADCTQLQIIIGFSLLDHRLSLRLRF